MVDVDGQISLQMALDIPNGFPQNQVSVNPTAPETLYMYSEHMRTQYSIFKNATINNCNEQSWVKKECQNT